MSKQTILRVEKSLLIPSSKEDVNKDDPKQEDALREARASPTHCKYLHLEYISTTTLEMYASPASGVRLQDVAHYISSTSISCSAAVLRFKYNLSVVLYTVKNILPFQEGMFT